MKNKYIKILNLDDLSEFVSEASKVKNDILVYRGKFCVDGKSLMGMTYINIFDGGRIQYPDDAIEFEKYISKFEM